MLELSSSHGNGVIVSLALSATNEDAAAAAGARPTRCDLPETDLPCLVVPTPKQSRPPSRLPTAEAAAAAATTRPQSRAPLPLQFSPPQQQKLVVEGLDAVVTQSAGVNDLPNVFCSSDTSVETKAGSAPRLG